ncbi:MAG: NAD-dependent epimerase/dehydratase family protein [Terrimicrobiaceae bacterium]|nr:NAD-dependent epimerase/dehydratase family protein [Terrimicrobiaceae bacterium]
MSKRILITGGGGFVGSHLADELLGGGDHVRALDNLCSQVHGESAPRPPYLSRDVEILRGDTTDPHAVWKALDGVDAVVHLAAAVGVGQSMYEIEHYTRVNAIGTAVLLEALAKRPVGRLVVASSMSIYGEGVYRTRDGHRIEPAGRSVEQLRARDWNLRDSDGASLLPLPTPESKCPAVRSVYALSKYYQERLCMTVGPAYGIPTVALRFFNIYGTRQALSNPYTGVLAIFASRLMNDRPPLVNEDGEQRRDFVNVRDVVQACRLALDHPAAANQVFNVGSGQALSIREVAVAMAAAVGKPEIEPEITQRFRVGDIRNCFADISKATQLLGYRPTVRFEDGVRELAGWLDNQTAVDRVDAAAQELIARGLAA